MKNSLETRLGIFVALALVVVFLLIEMVGSKAAFSTGVPVTARFSDVQELKVGDPVKMAGVVVGAVESIKLDGTGVVVGLRVSPAAGVRTNSKATIKFVGLLGQNYVSLTFGTASAPLVTSEAVLESAEQPDLSGLMARMDSVAAEVQGLAESFSADNFSTLLAPFTDFLADNEQNLSGIISNTHAVTKQVVDGQGSIGKLVMNDAFYESTMSTVTQMGGAVTNINETFGGAKAIVAKIQAGEGSLGKMMTDEAVFNEAQEALTSLKQVLQKINQGQGSIGLLVNDPAFYNNAKLTLQKVDKATESLEDQGPLSVLGLAVNSLF